MKMILSLVSLTAVSVALTSCGASSSSSQEDSSASGTVASAVGGALSNSDNNGTLAALFQNRSMADRLYSKIVPDVLATTSCPTFHDSGAGSGCSSSGDTIWLSYSDCTFLGHATWNGVQALISSSSASCGTFPNPGANGNLVRQFQSSAGGTTPGSLTLTSKFGTEAVVDDASSNLDNFDNDSISTIANGGYGSQVSFNASGARDQLVIAHHISVSGVFDHSLSGTLSISEQPGASSRTVNGSVNLYHNLLKVIGTSTLTDVVHDDTCCLPVSGSISTVFSAGSNVSPTRLGALMVGKSETLTFTGCGTGTLQTYDGKTENVTLSRCF